ncbi:Uncharacterized protein dnm_049540 [Desulfonema magnum]|uniref:Uncharacterized protein n=1 Tax=Desulfonema magnum TaxID=45655 RepID=A0A975BP85_9BACT|nr:Uncharacterized protein dnm_049540 [Desulfonema magnum]
MGLCQNHNNIWVVICFYVLISGSQMKEGEMKLKICLPGLLTKYFHLCPKP